jgi:hypothetical protein
VHHDDGNGFRFAAAVAGLSRFGTPAGAGRGQRGEHEEFEGLNHSVDGSLQ